MILPKGMRIYVKKRDKTHMFLQPNRILPDDVMHTAYDVRYGGQTVIPRDVRIVGDWISDSECQVQFQAKAVYLCGLNYPIQADSLIIQGRPMRDVVLDNNSEPLTTTYLEIQTTEIPLDLIQDFYLDLQKISPNN